MTRQEVVIVNALGLHARAAARFVQVAGRFRSRITLAGDGRTADGKSILGLLALIARHGTRLVLSADGPDESLAVQTLSDLVAARFGEET